MFILLGECISIVFYSIRTKAVLNVFFHFEELIQVFPVLVLRAEFACFLVPDIR